MIRLTVPLEIFGEEEGFPHDLKRSRSRNILKRALVYVGYRVRVDPICLPLWPGFTNLNLKLLLATFKCRRTNT